MNVAFLIDDFSAIGGIQRVTSLIANALAKENEVHVLSMYQEHGDTNTNLYSDKVKLVTLIQGKKKYIQQCLKMVALIHQYLKNNHIDIVVATSEMLSPYCWLGCASLNIPYLCWTHTPAGSFEEAKLQRAFKWLGAKTSKVMIALTVNTKEELKKRYNTDKVVNIPNPIDPKLMKEVRYNPDTKKIVTVGRICVQKNYGDLVKVANIVLHQYHDWTWDIYGDGELKKETEELIRESDLEGKLILKGNTDKMYDLYNDYSIQVMTSKWEGFPMVLLEGMSNGLPLLAFVINGVSEVIKDGINGYLIEDFNIEEMADKISALIKDRDLRLNMSKANLSLRENYTIEDVVPKWNELFKKITNEK